MTTVPHEPVDDPEFALEQRTPDQVSSAWIYCVFTLLCMKTIVSRQGDTGTPWSLATVVRFKRSEEGVTAVEYGLIVALIAAVILTAVSTVGTTVSTEFINMARQLSTSNAAAR